MVTTPILEKFQKAYNENKYDVFVFEGGSRCFAPNQHVITQAGSIPISEIKEGDSVKTFNEKTCATEYKSVNCIYKFNNTKRTVKVKLKNGKEIICTEDHKFYYKGEWKPIKEILQLL